MGVVDFMPPCGRCQLYMWVQFGRCALQTCRRPATPTLRAAKYFYLRIVTGHNDHITSLTY
jgi:hypothetical protein